MRLKPGARWLAAGLAGVVAVGLIGTAGVALAQSSGDPSTDQAPGGPPPDQARCHPPDRHPIKRGFAELVKASGLERQVVAEGLKNGQSLAEIFEANGVDTDEVIESVLEELEQALDEKVEAGALSEEKAARIYEAAEKGLPRIANAHRPPPGNGRPGPGRDALAHELKIAADTIGIPVAELAEMLRDGGTIAEAAEANEVEVDTVIEAMVAPVNDRIDEAVANGRIDESKGDELKERALDRITRFVNEGLPQPPSP